MNSIFLFNYFLYFFIDDFFSLGEEKAEESKYARNLIQLDNGIKISPNPKDWKCYESGMTENLWLNLSTGVIGSGRRNWDGSGGTGAALKHFEETGRKYPLVVKLGTITPKGADVYSYAPDEDNLVEDPLLAEHLAHWGINMMKMKKTEKTMAELDIDLNLSYEFDRLTESNTANNKLTGPGLIGLKNLGNSCYCNSVFQILFSIPAFRDKYLQHADTIFRLINANAATDFNVQLAKLAVGLLTSRHEKDQAVSPKMLKVLLGSGHPEFSTNRQQDALEYFQHLLQKFERNEKVLSHELANLLQGFHNEFQFEFETRLQCNASKQVRYQRNLDNVLSLAIPLDAATNLAEVQAYQNTVSALTDPRDKASIPSVRYHVPFEPVIQRFAEGEVINDFFSPATKVRGTANKHVRFATFPNYLVIQLRRYILAEDWTPKKLDAEVQMPLQLNLESLRGRGIQAGEVELPEDDAKQQPKEEKVKPDAAIVNQLLEMGFSNNACQRAAIGVLNSSYDAAATWLMEHMEDANINDPLPSDDNPPPSAADDSLNEEGLAILLSMGLDAAHATRGLKECGGDVERAIDWCFSHEPVADEPVAAAGNDRNNSGLIDGKGEYELLAIVSHIGSNTACGHYVCHIRKEGKWVIYNDEKVIYSLSYFSLFYLLNIR